jgi:cytochrome c-type biogenesis protein CcmH
MGWALLIVSLLLLAACDRNVEPFDPGEEPRPPDLARIFPPGADRAAEAAPDGAPVLPQRGAPPVGTEGAPVRGTLELAPELEGRVPSGAILFLIARSAGAGPPLAVKRIPEPRFPLEFEIGPNDRMIQQLPFSGPLRISARVDGDGNATTREPGDLLGESPGDVEPGDSGVVVTIDQAL